MKTRIEREPVMRFDSGIVLAALLMILSGRLGAQPKKTSTAKAEVIPMARKVPAGKLSLTGQVVNAASKAPLSGVHVWLRPHGLALAVRSDAQGRFKITGLADRRISVMAFKEGYQIGQVPVAHIASTRVVNVRLVPLTLPVRKIGPVRQVTVDGFGRTRGADIMVRRGQHVVIDATGRMRASQLAGMTGPNGTKKAMAGYGLVAKVPFGALMYEVGEEGTWGFAGEHVSFTAAADGPLRFEINDNNKGDNDPRQEFRVRVSVE